MSTFAEKRELTLSNEGMLVENTTLPRINQFLLKMVVPLLNNPKLKPTIL